LTFTVVNVDSVYVTEAAAKVYIKKPSESKIFKAKLTAWSPIR
jgi:hypothetical protein